MSCRCYFMNLIACNLMYLAPFLSDCHPAFFHNNILSAPSYDIYKCPLKRWARAKSYLTDFNSILLFAQQIALTGIGGIQTEIDITWVKRCNHELNGRYHVLISFPDSDILIECKHAWGSSWIALEMLLFKFMRSHKFFLFLIRKRFTQNLNL